MQKIYHLDLFKNGISRIIGKELKQDLLDPDSDDNKIELKLIWSMKISRRPLCLFDSSAKYQKQLERENFSS